MSRHPQPNRLKWSYRLSAGLLAVVLGGTGASAQEKPLQKGDTVTVGTGRLICTSYEAQIAAAEPPMYTEMSPEGLPQAVMDDQPPLGCRLITTPTQMQVYNFIGHAVVLQLQGQKVWWSPIVDNGRQIRLNSVPGRPSHHP
jgi:hypothetical protein